MTPDFQKMAEPFWSHHECDDVELARHAYLKGLEAGKGIATNASVVEFAKWMGRNEASDCATRIANAIQSAIKEARR